ncbi:MAG: PAS domain S-box protein [Rhodocyclales bacterium]|nr:PAS domain S-box protein [Rhodocyclales bacterium]
MTRAGRSGLGTRALSRRLIVWTVVFSGALALLITTVQLLVEYRRDVDTVEQRFDLVQHGYLASIVDNVWVADREHLGTLLDGIVHLPDFAYAQVSVDGKPFVERGKAAGAGGITRTWPLQREYRGRQLVIGELTISADLATARQRFVERAVFIVLANFVKTVLVAFFMLLLVDRIITRHLEKIVDYLANSSPERLGTPLRLARRPREDELDRLVAALNRLHADLAANHEQLQESEARYRRLATQAPVGIVHFDGTRHITYANPCIASIFGVAPESLPGLDLDGLNDKRLLPAFAGALAGRSANYEGEFAFAPNRGSRQVAVHAAPVTDHLGEIVGGIAIVEDVTERRRAEAEIRELNALLERRVADRTAELERANKELEAFAHSVSHDLQAPLRAIVGYSQILVDDERNRLSDNGRDMLGRVIRNTHRMSELIENILQYSRAGRRALEKGRVDLGALAHEIAAQFGPDYPAAHIRIGDIPAAVGDPTMLEQVLQNLIGNALKYSSKQEHPEIEIGSERRDGHTVYFVKDNGAGFDMRYADKMFGMFQRLHPENQFPGTGVGLAIVKRLIERHGGEIWAKAEVGHGAQFYFTLDGTAV